MILTPTNELLPEHAKSNLVDPSSGKNNVIEAPVDQKEYGFYPVGKKPNRSYTNWLFRQTYRYLLWLKETFFVEVDNLLEQHQTRIEALEPTVDGHTTQITGLDIRLDTAESTIDNHEARLDIVEPAIVNIANDLATVAGEVDTLQGQVGGFDSRLDILEDISPVTIPAYVPAGEFTVRYDFNLLAWKSSGMTFIHFPSVRKETANNELNILFESFPDILLPPAAAGDPARNVLVPLMLRLN